MIVVLSTTYGWNIFGQKTSSPIPPNDLSQSLKHSVEILSKDIGIRNYKYYSNLEKSAEFIKQSFQESHYAVEEWGYDVNGQKFNNIVAPLRNNDSNEYMVIGAHYDSCFNPGADDNASGVAGLIELARLLKNEKLETNILFVAFVNEEPPFFTTDQMGSRVFVKELGKKGVKVKSAVVLEMIGFYSDKWFSQRYLPLLGPFYPNKGNFIALVGNFPSRALVSGIQQQFNKESFIKMKSVVAPSFIPGVYFSDHASFWNVGIPAVMVTDTAYLRNKNYHLKTDTVEKLDFDRMAEVILGLKESLLHLANQ